jgi:hypothetical protein
MVLDFKRSSGEDARALTASSGGKHRLEKYMDMFLFFLDLTGTSNMISKNVFWKNIPMYSQKNRRTRVTW